MNQPEQLQAILIADLHLSPERPAVTQAFITFLQKRACLAAELFILGDLFEAWIGDDDPSPLAVTVKAALKQLSGKGTRIYFQHGNRDFLVGKKFCQQTGAVLLSDHHVITLAGQKTLLLHGDTLCTDDIDYQRFRRKARNPVYKWLLRHLPLKKRQQIAADWRAKSKMVNANKPDNIMDVCQPEVERVLKKHGATQMIHGHTHRPAVHQHNNGRRFVLGDWHTTGWCISAGDNNLALEEFEINPDTNPQ